MIPRTAGSAQTVYRDHPDGHGTGTARERPGTARKRPSSGVGMAEFAEKHPHGDLNGAEAFGAAAASTTAVLVLEPASEPVLVPRRSCTTPVKQWIVRNQPSVPGTNVTRPSVWAGEAVYLWRLPSRQSPLGDS